MGEDKRERVHEPVFQAAEVSQGTFYKILKGKGQGVRQSQITALAQVLGVPIPMIDRVIRLPGDPLYVQPPTSDPGASAIDELHHHTKGGGAGGGSKRKRRAG